MRSFCLLPLIARPSAAAPKRLCAAWISTKPPRASGTALYGRTCAGVKAKASALNAGSDVQLPRHECLHDLSRRSTAGEPR